MIEMIVIFGLILITLIGGCIVFNNIDYDVEDGENDAKK